MTTIEESLQQIINDIKKLQERILFSNLDSHYPYFNEFKEFFLENFELTNNKKHYILCSEITNFYIKHFPHEISGSQIDRMLNKIIKTTTKRLNNKTFKAKLGLKPIKLNFEFSSARDFS
jgi:hypothetical protein